MTVPTTAEAIESVLRPVNRRSPVDFKVCPQDQWVGSVIRTLAAEVRGANPASILWLLRDGRMKVFALTNNGQIPQFASYPYKKELRPAPKRRTEFN